MSSGFDSSKIKNKISSLYSDEFELHSVKAVDKAPGWES